MKKNLSLLGILIALCGVAAIAYYFIGEPNAMSTVVMSDFQVADTSQVTQFDITSMNGESASLKRDKATGHWIINDKYRAKDSAVELILKTFSRIEVRSPVAESARKGVITNMATAGMRVDIYLNDALNKSYILGTSAIDHYGSHMLLEKPEEGRSSVPYVVHIKGFSGFLNPRFFVEENEWRYTGVFEYPTLAFSKVEFIDHVHEANSFGIDYKGGNDIKLRSIYLNSDLNTFDTLKVKDYLLQFKKAHVETYKNYLSKEVEDSLIVTRPNFTISLLDNDGKTTAIDLYYFLENDDEGNMVPNADRMYGKTEDGEIALVQTYTFGPFIKDLSYFVN